jgi:hypothetical protein
MKNAFVMASAILLATYPLAVLAGYLGILPATVMSFPSFIGFFTAANFVALVVHDYTSRPASYAVRREEVGASVARPRLARSSSGTAMALRTTS